MNPESVAPSWQAALRLVGLGVRARTVTVGVEGVRNAALRGKLVLAIAASDASRHSMQKVASLLAARGVILLIGPGSNDLGAAVGRTAVAVIGVLDNQLAAGISRTLAALQDTVIEESGFEQA
jgi:ribosomal protein L7Ae-like RNA K-turn-binding protein